MVEAAKESGKFLTIGYQTRSQMAHQYVRHMVERGELGEVYYVKAPSIRRRGVPLWGVFLDKEKQGGGPLIDIGTHSIDAALSLIGNYDVESVTGLGVPQAGGHGHEFQRVGHLGTPRTLRWRTPPWAG